MHRISPVWVCRGYSTTTLKKWINPAFRSINIWYNGVALWPDSVKCSYSRYGYLVITSSAPANRELRLKHCFVADFALSYTPVYSRKNEPGSSVNVVTSRWAGQKENSGVQLPVRQDASLCLHVHTGQVQDQPASPAVGTAALPPGLERPWCDVNCSSVSSAKAEYPPQAQGLWYAVEQSFIPVFR